jgi:AcrR family transcriptional regulator
MKRTRRSRKPHAALDRDRIARAALARIDAGGPASLSMRSLAGDLGCEAMSLYHHVEGIEGVLDAVVDRLFGEVLRVAEAGTGPRPTLEAFARAYLAQAAEHPRAFPLLATRLLHTPQALAAVARVLALLGELGLAHRDALRHARVLGAYLNGAGLALAAWSLAPDAGARSARAGRNEAALARLGGDINEAAVRDDLDAGLMRLLNAIPAGSIAPFPGGHAEV